MLEANANAWFVAKAPMSVALFFIYFLLGCGIWVMGGNDKISSENLHPGDRLGGYCNSWRAEPSWMSLRKNMWQAHG